MWSSLASSFGAGARNRRPADLDTSSRSRPYRDRLRSTSAALRLRSGACAGCRRAGRGPVVEHAQRDEQADEEDDDADPCEMLHELTPTPRRAEHPDRGLSPRWKSLGVT